MSTTTTQRATPPLPPRSQAAASPVALYEQLRREGAGHARAVEMVEQQYEFMRGSAERELSGVRAKVERPPKPQPAPPPEPEAEPPDQLDAIEADARRELEQAKATERRLALDAFTDDDVADELRNAQSKRAAAEARLRQADLARDERKRDVAERAAQTERERVAKERGLADSLSGKIEGACRAEDKAAAAFARIVSERRALEARQAEHLMAAGIERRSSPWGTSRGELSLRLAARASGCESEFAWAGRAPEQLNGKP
jgi:hypothetical protein